MDGAFEEEERERGRERESQVGYINKLKRHRLSSE